jgi:hypothetical protein
MTGMGWKQFFRAWAPRLEGTNEFGSLGLNERIDSWRAAARLRIPLSGSKKLSRKNLFIALVPIFCIA